MLCIKYAMSVHLKQTYPYLIYQKHASTLRTRNICVYRYNILEYESNCQPYSLTVLTAWIQLKSDLYSFTHRKGYFYGRLVSDTMLICSYFH